MTASINREAREEREDLISKTNFARFAPFAVILEPLRLPLWG
jgi:hypothetical protein